MTGEPRGDGRCAAEIAFDDGSRGAEVWRSCALCHALTPDDGNRAGPTMHGIFGRRIGTAEGYDFSQALREMDIVWTPQKVADLFKYGPEAYTPGSRMPEQRIPAEDVRQALVEFSAAHDGVRWAKEKRPVRTWQTGLQVADRWGGRKRSVAVSTPAMESGSRVVVIFLSPLPMHDAVFRGGTAFRRSQLHRMRLVLKWHLATTLDRRIYL